MIQNWWLVDDDTLGKVREFLRGKDNDLLHLVDTGMHKTDAVPSDFQIDSGSPNQKDVFDMIEMYRTSSNVKIEPDDVGNSAAWLRLLKDKTKEVSGSIDDGLIDAQIQFDLVSLVSTVIAWIEELSIPAD